MSTTIKANIISGNTIKANVEAGGNIRVNAVTGSVKSVTAPDVIIKASIKDQGPKGATGATGPANTLDIGTVISGVTAAATITGTAPTQTLNLVLPKGDKGDKGDPGTGITEETVGFTITGGTTPKTLTVSLDASVSGTNTGDQTLPTKATGTELDTGTDDDKFATAKSLKDSHNVPSVTPGTSGNLLTSDGTDWTSAAPPVSVSVTTKGDLQTHNGTAPDRLAVGSDGEIPTADNSQTTGIKYVAPASSSDITTGTEQVKRITPKGLADADLNTRLKSKMIEFTRDGTASTGDVSYTGVGFQPTSLKAISAVSGTLYRSDGHSDSVKNQETIYQSAANVYNFIYALICYSNQASWGQSAQVKSYDSDGFTLTWTKAGTPTSGTITCSVICYR